MKPLVAVSFYDRRSIEPLKALLETMHSHAAGVDHDLMLIVNSTGDMRLPEEIARHFTEVVYRPNLGMNIGAWSAAWRIAPGRPFYLFLQDECYIVRDGWLSAYAQKLEAGAGLVGESLNLNWDKPWEILRNTLGKDVLPEHFLGNIPANRVDVYLDFMRKREIDPGRSGLHLRSLAWGLTGSLLERMGGFPSGRNYGECIAAEIGVSRHVVALGYSVEQLSPDPFNAIRHREWNQDSAGARWSHKPIWLEENKKLKIRIEALEEKFTRPRTHDVANIIKSWLLGRRHEK